jgi:hypothetical protein
MERKLKRMIDSTVFEPLIFRLYSVDSQLRDDGITIIETDQITEDIESISEKLKNQKDSTAQFHFHNALIIKQVSDVLNNLSYEAQKKFLKGFSPYLQKVYILGFLLIILTLIMLSALWLHLFMENLFKLDREVYETEAVKLKDFQSYSQIKVVKAFILLILLMAVPIFRMCQQKIYIGKIPYNLSIGKIAGSQLENPLLRFQSIGILFFICPTL